MSSITDLGSGVPFGLAATICTAPAAFCVLTLLRAARARADAPRTAYVTAATAVTAGWASTVAVAMIASGTGGTAGPVPVSVGSPGGAELIAAAVGYGFAPVVLAVALLALPAVVAKPVRGARLLDGVLTATCAFFVGWTLYLEPWHTRRVGHPMPARLTFAWLAVVTPTILIVAVLGVSLVSGAYLWRTRTGAFGLCIGAALVSVGAAGLLFATAGHGGAVLAIGTVAQSAGNLGLARGVRQLDRARGPIELPIFGGVAISVVSVGVAVGACLLRLTLHDYVDQVSVYLACVIGGLLAAQQAIARHDIKRYAIRLAEREAHFRTMAHTDPLTGLANRRELLRVLSDDAAGGPPCVLLAIDLDGFKNINDIRGHDAGDAVLSQVASRLRANVRPGDCAARLGGDEFAVLMWARPTEAGSVADRILGVLNQPYELTTGTVFVSASIGLAGCAEADSIASLLRNADLALRFAKQAGKNRVSAYDVGYDEEIKRRTDLEHELRGAVERGELMLVYQPLVDLPGRRVAGVEALLRWHHPRLGTVSPAEFIPLAEDTGLIHGLGAFVVHEACHQLSRWLADGHDVWLSINASVRELHTLEYAQQVAEVLRTHRVPTERVVIEITEHAAALDVAGLRDRLTALRATGVRVALDDFGSGYSSLNVLRTLPVDLLKIDHALLDTGSESAMPLVDAVVGLGQRLGLDVVAEGVRTDEQIALLTSCGCRYAQGQLCGEPLPAERVEALFGPTIETEVIAVHPGLPAQNVGAVDSAHEIRQS